MLLTIVSSHSTSLSDVSGESLLLDLCCFIRVYLNAMDNLTMSICRARAVCLGEIMCCFIQSNTHNQTLALFYNDTSFVQWTMINYSLMVFVCFFFAICTKLQYLRDKLLSRLFFNEAIQILKNAYWNIVTHYLISHITSRKLKGFVIFIFCYMEN